MGPFLAGFADELIKLGAMTQESVPVREFPGGDVARGIFSSLSGTNPSALKPGKSLNTGIAPYTARAPSSITTPPRMMQYASGSV